MFEYEAVIGLEVHAQLKTRSKLFCACSTTFGQGPNSNSCPVCSGMPGSLPVINKRAVEFAVKMSLAVGCKINYSSVFARKNYFYPDLPKGYQISQYENPLAEHGALRIQINNSEKSIRIIRIHMEDDAGKSIHSATDNLSYVDLNRTGVPLIEIVSGPDLESADEAVAYLKSLRNILLYLEICEGNMEEGNFRCDANVSIRPKGWQEFGTRTELKNMNSFRHVHKALEYEIGRQKELLDDGEKVVQETRLFDEVKNETRTMRSKEEAHDYRYFPDPDLVPVYLHQEQIDQWKQELPELPSSKKKRFIQDYRLPEYDSEILTGNRVLADYFEEAANRSSDPKIVSNWIMTDLLRELHEHGLRESEIKFSSRKLAKLIRLVEEGKISMKMGKEIFPELFKTGMDPEEYIKLHNLVQISDLDQLEQTVKEVLQEHPNEVKSYKQGKKKLLSFFMGQVMKKTRGQANPKLVNELLQSELK